MKFPDSVKRSLKYLYETCIMNTGLGSHVYSVLSANFLVNMLCRSQRAESGKPQSFFGVYCVVSIFLQRWWWHLLVIGDQSRLFWNHVHLHHPLCGSDWILDHRMCWYGCTCLHLIGRILYYKQHDLIFVHFSGHCAVLTDSWIVLTNWEILAHVGKHISSKNEKMLTNFFCQIPTLITPPLPTHTIPSGTMTSHIGKKVAPYHDVWKPISPPIPCKIMVLDILGISSTQWSP